MKLPAAFEQQMKEILPDSFEQFFQTVQEGLPPTTIRWNPFKISPRPENTDKVKWHNNGEYLAKRPVFTLDPFLHAGAYYVQEASSMFLAEAVRQIASLDQPLRVLDLCGAPGGKSSLLSSLLSADSLLLSNEVIRSRFQILKENMIKWGQPHTLLSNHDSRDFQALEGFFDLVVVDAPCSGEGLFRKDHEAVQQWSPENVQLCSSRQRRILAQAAKSVAAGGQLIYCTCTYNRHENEVNAAWLCKEFGLEPITLELREDWHIEQRSIGYQFYPHRVKGEGFYLSCFRKMGSKSSPPKSKKGTLKGKYQTLSKKQKASLKDWLRADHSCQFLLDAKNRIFAVPQAQEQAVQQIAQTLRNCIPAIEIGSLKHDLFLPSHGLAMSNLAKAEIPRVELDKQQALLYLKKEAFPLDPIPNGWALVCYQNLPLGWIKGLKNRFNNYYPKEWRIRMQLDRVQ